MGGTTSRNVGQDQQPGEKIDLRNNERRALEVGGLKAVSFLESFSQESARMLRKKSRKKKEERKKTSICRGNQERMKEK